MSATFDGYSARDKAQESIKTELSALESELKDWFLTRRLKAERAVSIKKELDANNFSGLTAVNGAVPAAEAQLWKDITTGKPRLEDELSGDARKRKAERYLTTFENATTHEHVCRVPGMAFFRCLQSNTGLTSAERDHKCVSAFGEFDACRSGVKQQQTAALNNAIAKQDIEDARAKALFARRQTLLNNLGQH